MGCLDEVARQHRKRPLQQGQPLPSPSFSGPSSQGHYVPFCGVCHPHAAEWNGSDGYLHIDLRSLSQTRMVQQQDQPRCPNSIQSRLHKTPTPAAHHETHAMPSVTVMSSTGPSSSATSRRRAVFSWRESSGRALLSAGLSAKYSRFRQTDVAYLCNSPAPSWCRQP